MRRCLVCGAEKPLDEFVKRKDSSSGRGNRCRKCQSAAAQVWAKQNPERHAAHLVKSQRVTHWDRRLVQTCRRVAREKGYAFDLDEAFLFELHARQGGKCHWFGIPLQPSIEKRNPLQPSVDRLDPSGGYTRDNVVLACQFANLGRSEMSAERFREFVASLRAQLISQIGETPSQEPSSG